jgi:hypothetical protein
MKESFFEKGNECFVMEYCFKGDLNALMKKPKDENEIIGENVYYFFLA